jgi:hypothetical protein
MKNEEQFHRSRVNVNPDEKSAPFIIDENESPEGFAPISPDLSFSEFMLASPLADSGLTIPRDFNSDRYIQIQE